MPSGRPSGRTRTALLGIGTLTEIEILNPRTKRVTKRRIHGRWLAWDTRKRTFVVCQVVTPNAGGAKQVMTVAKAHRKFHRAAPRTAALVNVPSRTHPLTSLGLLKALVYEVPRALRSPEKNRYRWHHAFGDTGHQGGEAYPERVMPALLRDRLGNLFIKRRPGNIFTVDTWLRG